MSKAMEGGKSSAIEGTKKRTPHIMPTHRQLAYLDELKTHLLLMRERQAIFMEQTAKMLTGISSVNMVDHEPAADGASPLAESNKGEPKTSKSNPNIKQLIQRFEDLRQTSQKFTDLPDVPEELINVDVRRILQGYEKLIEEGNIIQQSWLLLKNSTETCVRFANGMLPTSEDQPNPSSLAKTKLRIAEVSDVAARCGMRAILSQDEGQTSQYPNAGRGAELSDKDWELYEIKKDLKHSAKAKNRDQPRMGPFLRLIIRLLKPLHCGIKCSKKPTKKCSPTLIASVPTKKPEKKPGKKPRKRSMLQNPITQNAQVKMQT
ncbi:hypothetical protein KR038_000197 [Drosophila bunnanda]|nr:hypothetical protein KR038_000197 [Drosophila bunnanda]